MLYRLVYYSHNHITGGNEALEPELAQILEKSRQNNARDGITGALLFNSGCFAQVLEGPLEVVEAAFERIQQDDRHGEVSLLALEPVEQRSFPNWAMGFVGNRQGDAARYAAIGQASGFDPGRLDGNQLHALLKDLAIEEEAAA